MSSVQTELIRDMCELTDVVFNPSLISGGLIKFYASELLKGCTYVLTITVEVRSVVKTWACCIAV